MNFFEEVIKAGGADKLNWLVTGCNFVPYGNKYLVTIYVQGENILSDNNDEVLEIEINDLSEVPELLSSPPEGAKRLREMICPKGCLGVYEEV